MGWSEAEIPDQRGRVVVVTGGNSGIGWEASRALAQKGARVVIACRSASKGDEARQRILAESEDAEVEVRSLDLASIASVKVFSERLKAEIPRVDVLINNAGVMALPFAKTEDGLEMQMGTNHFGHFALTGSLLPLLGEGARVVTVSSIMHRRAKLDFENLNAEKSYHPWVAYGYSKLANLLFTYELDRRLRTQGLPVKAVACHPGYASTNLQFVGPQQSGSWLREKFMSIGNAVVAQSAAAGALPTMFAATAPSVQGGQYVGPGGLLEMWGAPRVVSSNAESHREDHAKRLWERSIELTGVAFLE